MIPVQLPPPESCPGCGVEPRHPDDLSPGLPFDDPPWCTLECREFSDDQEMETT